MAIDVNSYLFPFCLLAKWLICLLTDVPDRHTFVSYGLHDREREKVNESLQSKMEGVLIVEGVREDKESEHNE